MQKLHIRCKSFNHTQLKKTMNKICQIGGEKSTIHFLPTTKKKYTVERSPHIDKKSREQFEIRRYKGSILLSLNNSLNTSIILYALKNSLFPGVDLQISIQFYDFVPQTQTTAPKLT